MPGAGCFEMPGRSSPPVVFPSERTDRRIGETHDLCHRANRLRPHSMVRANRQVPRLRLKIGGGGVHQSKRGPLGCRSSRSPRFPSGDAPLPVMCPKARRPARSTSAEDGRRVTRSSRSIVVNRSSLECERARPLDLIPLAERLCWYDDPPRVCSPPCRFRPKSSSAAVETRSGGGPASDG